MPAGARSIHSPNVQWLDGLLRHRVVATRSAISQFPARGRHPDNVQTSPKILFVQRGRYDYWLDDQLFVMRAGSMLYRPAPSVSHWRVGSRPVTMAWVEFTGDGLPTQPLALHGADASLEWSRLTRIDQLIAANDAIDRQEAEGELKAVLARFFRRAQPIGSGVITSIQSSPAVRRALEFLSRHHAEPGVLARLPQITGMSPAHFRRLFHKQVKTNARTYLLNLRLRAARYQVQYTTLSIKQIAGAVGYRDPLFFSRHYRKLFGRSPTQDRAFTP